MGPTKVVIKDGGLYEATSGKLIKDGFTTHEAMEDYAAHHYLVLPVVDKKGQPWSYEGQPIYCVHGVQYETLTGEVLHLARCPDCGGMAIRDEEPVVDSECIRCVSCGHEFEPRLEMMES